MAYKVIILYQLYMPSYFLGTFTEYPFLLFISRRYFSPLSGKISAIFFTRASSFSKRSL